MQPAERSIPRDKDFPADAVQCDPCGGYGCGACGQRGWHADARHALGRRCANAECRRPLAPDQLSVYCTSLCARTDA